MTTDRDSKNIENIDCTEAIDKLYAYLDGEVDDADSINRLEHHLGHCHSCFTRSQVESALSARIKQTATKHTPESLQKRLRDMMDKF
jgi:anti-sigma factor (TIGR02949 family)